MDIKLNIVIPMAGFGHRFVEKNYKEPKPLIEVNGKKIISYVIDMFDKENDNFLFICNKQHSKTTNLKSFLENSVHNSKVVVIDNHKLGPVWTIKQAYQHIRDNEPVLFAHCDAPYTWDYVAFKRYITDINPDGCLINHIGFHPHSLLSGLMAHCRVSGDKVLEVKEKECFTNDCMSEPASSGSYYFKTGKLAKKYFDLAIKNNINYNDEFYITLVYNLLIRDNLEVKSYICDQMISLGTPIEIENFIAWNTIIDSLQCKNEKEILQCYRYWTRLKNQK